MRKLKMNPIRRTIGACDLLKRAHSLGVGLRGVKGRGGLALALLCAVLGVAGCAYQPLYSPDVAKQVRVGAVVMASAENLPGERRIAQHVHQRLQQAFPHKGRKPVQVTITESTTDLAVRSDASVERSSVVLRAQVRLSRALNEHLSRTLKASAAYNVEQSPFSTESGKQFARLRAADELSERIIRWIGHTLREDLGVSDGASLLEGAEKVVAEAATEPACEAVTVAKGAVY